MLQTLNPYTPTAKTAEIMARYRPIAPKPQNAGGAVVSSANSATGSGGSGYDGTGTETGGSGSGSGSSGMSPTIRQSPYLRNVWPQLQSRPTRTRKRGRTSLRPPPPATLKRPRTLLQGLSPPFHVAAKTLGLVTLPLLPFSSPHHMQQVQQQNVIDLNKEAEVPEEKDLLAQLQKQPTSNVIAPRPVRLVSSSVSIRVVKDDVESPVIMKKAEEIERELEAQVVPAFVSDSNNQVRLVNSTYKEMVGQPECAWVQAMVTGEVACKSICGNVELNFIGSDAVCSTGFSCWARIEWGANGKKNLVNAFGEAMRLACQSKDYKFAWRFHTGEPSEAAAAAAALKKTC